MCAVFGSRPSAVIAVGFTTLMLRAVLTVLKCGIFTQTFIAVVIPTIHVFSTAILAQFIALETTTVDAVGFKITNRHFSAPVTHILLGLCHDGVCLRGVVVCFLRCTVSGWFTGLLCL